MKLILQRFGIGDVIFSMTAIRSLNDKILWPVFPQYVDGLNAAYPDINFINSNLCNVDYNRKDRYFINDCEVIPLSHQDIPLKDCMKNKYSYFNLDWRHWKINGMYERNKEKEERLFKELGISKGESYNFISQTFQCDFKGKGNIHLDNGLKNVYLTQTPGYSLFNWSTVFERATTIHMVSSSNIYLMELLELKAKEIKLYIRRPQEKNHENYDYILQKHKYTLE